MGLRLKNWIKLLGVFVMKKALVFGVSLLMMVGLAGCSTSSSSSKNSSSSKAQTAQDKNYVRSGTLTKVDQWTKDNNIGKVTLTGISPISNKLLTQQTDKVQITLNDVKVLTVRGNKEQRDDAATEFEKDSLPAKYSYIQIQYTAKNISNKEVQLGGIKQLVMPNGNQLNQDDDFVDNGEGEDIAKDAKKTELAFVLLDSQNTGLKPDNIRIIFDESMPEDGIATYQKGFSFTTKINY